MKYEGIMKEIKKYGVMKKYEGNMTKYEEIRRKYEGKMKEL